MSSSPSLYADRDTFIHRLNARSKLALITGLFVMAYSFTDPVWVFVPLAASFLALVAVGGWPNFKRLSFIVVALFLVGFAVWPAFTHSGGAVLLSTPVGTLTEREVLFALGRSERIAAFIIGGLLFVTTTSNEEIVAGMRSLGIPFAFCFAVGTALRLFPTFLGSANTVRQAQAARGHEVGGNNPVTLLRSYIPLLIPVFMTAIRNVQTQAMALEARGFDTRGDRSFYNRQPFQTVDWAVVVVGLVAAVVSVALRLQGFGTI
ncbi:energy-coupling factor transporter transmembrane protein EcfT [Salinadaptatus halalkaliphilus]|uniref:Energy-coupling factor transporter transmembrane protein EcfT n=1 Tax=Salinadaptatus halalkaliphilus TaxID=2419781 RepID=A0A4S3TQZ9_9EURY|nr:energy-coupling factor transporter transmembrane component T [Salinadaptatus halalkaliphilus]THE65743.1 energy-coupling factor transporter transmembrane protein EcfT [Salinadaptatus halalkaliphilus]